MFKMMQSLTTIGDRPEDSVERRQQQHFLIYMALFMSGGGLLWGGLCLYFNLLAPALIPFGYVILTALNLIYFKWTRHFSIVRTAQVTFSLALPVMFQLMLGGFVNSGGVMLWSLLALGASLTFSDFKLGFRWLILYVICVIACGYLDESARTHAPMSIDEGQSVIFFVINIATISSIFFVFTLLMLRDHKHIQLGLERANTHIRELVTSLEDRVDERTRELQEALGYNEAVFQSLDDGLLVVDLKHEVIAINAKQREILCLRDEDDDSTSSPVEYAQLSRDAQALIQHSINTQRAVNVELTPSSGVTVKATASPVLLSQGDELLAEPVGCVVLTRDITADKKLLEMEKKLAVSERMSALGTLAAGIAHEINNPLTYVMSNLELMREDLSGDQLTLQDLEIADLLELTAEALGGVERISKIVRELRSFMKSREVKREAVDLVQVIESALNLAQHEVRHIAQIETRLSPQLPLAYVDERQVVQVVVNMLINAAQAFAERDLRRNKIIVEVYSQQTQQSEESTPALVIKISDNASGMSPEVMRRAFDPFFTTKTAVGTGLGLALCHRMVQDLGGSIDLWSSEGVGTSFKISLPEYHPSSDHLAPEALVETVTSKTNLDGVKSVFVIDDEECVCATISRSLGADKTTSFTRAQDALSALDSLEAHEKPEVILCDVMMPEMNGIEFYRALNPGLAHRVCFITGGSTDHDVSNFLADHTSRVLYKPFSPERVRAQVLSIAREMRGVSDERDEF